MPVRFALICLALLFAVPAPARPAAQPPHIAYAKVPVADLDRALKFYTLLGMKRIQDFPGATVLAFPDGGKGTRLILLHGAQFAAYKSPIDFPALVFKLHDLPAVVKRLTDAGFTVPTPRDSGSTRDPKEVARLRKSRLFFGVAAISTPKDPDGHPVELLGQLEIPGDPPFVPHIRFTKTATADIATSAVFYSMLGLETMVDYPGEGRRFNMMFPGSERDGRTRFIINHGPRYVSYKAVDDVSRTVFAVPDLNATLARLAEVGFKPVQAPARATDGVERGHLVAVIKDRDGNAVELMQ